MTSVDHIIFAVSDLEEATRDYELILGRAPSWKGTHPEYGSANTLFQLENTYIELLAAEGRGFAADLVNNILSTRGQSLGGLVFGTKEVKTFLSWARSHGLDVAEPLPGYGIDNETGATRTWQSMFWDLQAARGIFSFCICHDEFPSLSMAKATTEACISAVDHVVVQTKDADAAKLFFGGQLGIRLALEQNVPAWGGTQLFFRTNSMSIEVIASSKVADVDMLWGIALKTQDIRAIHERLIESGVAVSEVREGRKSGTLVLTVKSNALDVPTLLIEHSL